MLDREVYFNMVKDRIPNSRTSEFLNALKAIILPTKNSVMIDYNLVATYINGQFRAIPQNQGLMEEGKLNDTYLLGNQKRYVERWDTAASTVSQNTYSRFRQALLPDGLDSFYVEINGNQDGGQDLELTEILRNSWNPDALTEIDSAVGDYMNYGTAVMTCQCRHLDINRVAFFELLNDQGQWTRAYFISTTPFYGSSMGYTGGTGGVYNSSNYLYSTGVEEPPILKIDFDFPAQLRRLVKMGKARSFTDYKMHEMPAGIFYQNTEGVELWKPYDRVALYEELYVARMGPRRAGYGTGCGVNALGPVVDANFTVGTRYLNLQRIIDPSWVKLSNVQTTTMSGQVGIDTSPGGITNVSNTSGVPMALDQMLRRDDQVQIEMQSFLPYRELFLKELDAAYNAFLFKPFEPVPANATATGAMIQLEDTINAYRAKADAFLENILIPMAEMKLKMALELAIQAAQIGDKTQEDYAKNVQIAELYFRLKDLGTDLRAKNAFRISVRDLAYVRRRQAAALEIQEQINLTTMAMQTAQMDQDFAQSMINKIKKHYK